MTAMSTSTREISINRLLELAAKTAGIMAMEQVASGSQWNARAKYGRDQLELVMDKLQAGSTITRDIEVATVDITEGTADYTLDSDTLDVLGSAMFRADGESSGTPVKQVDREEYVGTPDRTTEATPTRFWVERGATVVIHFLDVPNADGELEIQRKRLLADNTDGAATVDLERHWLDYLHHELAARYAAAAKMPAGEIKDLRDQAEAAHKLARAESKQNVPNEIVLDHPTPWS